MRRASSITGAILGLLLIPQVAGAAARIEIKEVDLSGWPKVELTIYADGAAAEDVTLAEDSASVRDVKVEPLTDAGGSVEVVLVIDTSGSMEGSAIVAAKQAARAFLEDVPPEVKVGLVTFSTRPLVTIAPRSDRGPLLDAVASASAEGETALYDALVAASRLVDQDAQSNVVVLSDGADTTSKNDLADAVAALRHPRASVYAVGLESSEMDVAALRRVALIGGGSFSTAETSDLSSIYKGLAQRIEEQFVVTYRSTAEPEAQIELEVATSSGSDSVVVLTPPGAATPETARLIEPDSPALLRGTAGLAIVLALFFVTFLAFAWLVLGGASRRRRDRELAARMAANQVLAEDAPDPATLLGLLRSVVSAADRVAEHPTWKGRLDHLLERAQVALTPGEFIAITLAGALAGGLLLAASLEPPILFGAVGLSVGATAPWLYVRIKTTRRTKKLHDQLADILMVIASSLRAGHSFLQSLDAVAREIADPGAYEFSRVVTEIRLGRSIEEALSDLADRADSEDLSWAVLAVNIQREVGGNLAELLDTVAETIRARENVRRQVKVLSAEGRLSIAILAGLPFAILLYMLIVNPAYISLLFTTRIGNVMSVVGVSLMTLGISWMRKVVRIDV